LIVFVAVYLLVSLGVMWLTGVRGVVIGAVCGLGAAFVVGAASTAGRRTERALREETNGDNCELLDRHSGWLPLRPADCRVEGNERIEQELEPLATGA
jgi:hypothetical protein